MVGLITSAGGALAAAIIALWKRQIVQAEKVEVELRKCVEKHDDAKETEIELVKQNAVLSERITSVESKVEGYQQARTDLKHLSEAVINILEAAPNTQIEHTDSTDP